MIRKSAASADYRGVAAEYDLVISTLIVERDAGLKMFDRLVEWH